MIRIPFLLLLLMAGTAVSAGAEGFLLFLPAIIAGQQDRVPPEPDLTVPLNDTGIVWSGIYPSGNDIGICNDANQDCAHGRDATLNNDSNGHAGFSFTKLSSIGAILADQSVDYATTPWACVKDNTTGLVWEVKTDDGGLHDRDNEYSWYNSDPATNGGDAGSNTGANTEDFVAAVNSEWLCSSSDWRVPTIRELLSIVNFNITDLAIDENYFPNIDGVTYWSSTTSAIDPGKAWGVEFGIGYTDRALTKLSGTSRYIRLVH